MGNNICEWTDIKDRYIESIVLGNGASRAFTDVFGYKSLYEEAVRLELIDSNLNALFRKFGITDFEVILHKLLQAENINHTLSINNEPIRDAYRICREALITVIQNIHPNYTDVEITQLDNAAIFLKRFGKVITLNYDLIIYWIMYRGNQEIKDENGNIIESGNQFKDGFIESSNGDKCFNPDLVFLQKPHGTRKTATLVFYLHGNLSLANFIENKLYEKEVKIVSPDSSQLGMIFCKWNSGCYSPLFVCEGESNNKLASIKSSKYLSAVYYDVLNQLGDSIAIYGLNFNDQDKYLIDRFHEINRKNPIKNMAVSVHIDGSEDEYMKRIKDIVNTRISKDIKIEFYNSKSKNCWNNKDIDVR